MNNRPMRISIEPDDISDTTISPSSSSYSSNCSSLSLSPVIPIANRIRQIASNVLPFDTFHGIDDDLSLPTYSDDSSVYEYSYCNKSCLLITFINFFLFFLYVIIDKNHVETLNPNVEKLFFRGFTEYPSCKDVRSEIWRLFTYSIVHNNLLHLFGNTLGLLISITMFYRFQKFTKILLVYFISIINGALSFYLTNPYSILIGSSGGVYGIFGSNIGNYIYNSDSMIQSEIIMSRIFILLFVIIDLFSFFVFYSKTVAYQVHYYSFCFGLLSGLVLYKTKKITKFKKTTRQVALILLCYFNSLLLFNYCFNNHPAKTFNYFEIEDVNSCCFEKFHFKGNISNFECTKFMENNFL